MDNLYLLLTPLLVLGVVALVRFIGCDIPFPLHDPPPQFAFVESTILGTPRNDFTGWVGMAIQVGPVGLKVTQLGRTMSTASTADHIVRLVQPEGTGGIDLGFVTIPPSAATTGFAYAYLTPPVELAANQTYYLLSLEAAGGDTFHDFKTTHVITTDVAQVTSSVFDDDIGSGFVLQGSLGDSFGPVDFKHFEPE